MPTLVNYSEWTPQQIKLSFNDHANLQAERHSVYSHLHDYEIDGYNFHLDPSHPQNKPLADLIRVG